MSAKPPYDRALSGRWVLRHGLWVPRRGTKQQRRREAARRMQRARRDRMWTLYGYARFALGGVVSVEIVRSGRP